MPCMYLSKEQEGNRISDICQTKCICKGSEKELKGFKVVWKKGKQRRHVLLNPLNYYTFTAEGYCAEKTSPTVARWVVGKSSL